jgi:hypothetical protein
MKCYTQVLTTKEFHKHINKFIDDAIYTNIQQSIHVDHILLQDDSLDLLDLSQESQLVCYKMNKVIEGFHIHQPYLVHWFHQLEISLQLPHLRGKLPIPHLGFDGLRVNHSAICCNFLKQATVKKLLDHARSYAMRNILPDKQRFTTGDVLTYYFENHMRVNMYDFKLECANQLKRTHQAIRFHPSWTFQTRIRPIPHDPMPVGLLFQNETETQTEEEEIPLNLMLEGAKSWLDDLDFGIDVEPTTSVSATADKKVHETHYTDKEELDF